MLTPSFKHDLTQLINKYSLESASHTPDHIIADYLVSCIHTFDRHINTRESYYNRDTEEQTTS